MPTFVSVSEEILDDRNGCNTQKNPLEINKKIFTHNFVWWLNLVDMNLLYQSQLANKIKAYFLKTIV